LFNDPKSFVFKLLWWMTCFPVNHRLRWHSYRWFVSSLISLKCIIKSQTPISPVKLHCLLQNGLDFSIWNFSLNIRLRMVNCGNMMSHMVFA
jgi:hypothetical protein